MTRRGREGSDVGKLYIAELAKLERGNLSLGWEIPGYPTLWVKY